MLDKKDQVSKSWAAYQAFTSSVNDFQKAIVLRDSEVWMGEVCLGSPNSPWVERLCEKIQTRS